MVSRATKGSPVPPPETTALVVSGTLVAISVEYARIARYRTRNQPVSHRAPRYRVRFEFVGEAPREVMTGQPPKRRLIEDLRASRPGDQIEATLSADGSELTGWINRSYDSLLANFGGTWGEQD